MNIKSELKKFIRKIDIFFSSEEIKKVVENYENFNDYTIILNDKIDNFIEWYTDNIVRDHYTDIGLIYEPRDLRNFIEKMAVWYELRYPDYEVDRVIYNCDENQRSVNEIMFNDNRYINDLFDENADIRYLDWNEFYNTKAFIDTLPYEEKKNLSKVKYYDYARLFTNPHESDIYIYLTSKGCIRYIRNSYSGSINDKKLDMNDFIGKNIKDVVVILKEEYDCTDEQLKEINDTIKEFEMYKYFKKELLNCVMYRIIERGGTIDGARRAFLFAKEFNCNIEVPMMYGINTAAPKFKNFLNEYLKSGGSKDLICFTNYEAKANKNKRLETTTVEELIKLKLHSSEEIDLYQRLVNVLSTQIDQDVVKQEEVKKLRLQRNFNKKRN